MNRLLKLSVTLLVGAALMAACGKKEQSDTTGWNYNDQKWGGFEKTKLRRAGDWAKLGFGRGWHLYDGAD